MKNSIFKVLAVFLMVVSVTFMGASIAAYYNRPEVTSEMVAGPMKDYTFTRNPGENPTWTVTRRIGDKGSVGNFKTPYEALVKAHQDVVTRKNGEAGEASTKLQALKDAAGPLETFRISQEQDRLAMNKRVADLRTVSTTFDQALLKKSEELQALSVQSRVIRDETAVRRTDVVRMRNELEEARTDLFRLNEIKRVLTDRLLRLQLDNQALEERKNQLESQVSAN